MCFLPMCASHPTGAVFVLPLTQQSIFLQSLSSVPFPRVCMDVCVPLTSLYPSPNNLFFLQSLTSVLLPPAYVQVSVPLTRQNLCTLCLSPNNQISCASHPTIYFLVEFDQCASSPCLHGGDCTSHTTGPVCNCTGTGYGGKYCHTSK